MVLSKLEMVIDEVTHGGQRLLLFTGARGTGKTLLMKKLVEYAEKNSLSAAYAAFHTGESAEEIMTRLANSLQQHDKIPSRKAGSVDASYLAEIMHRSHAGTVLLIDDLDESENPEKVTRRMAELIQEKKNAGIAIIVGSRNAALKGSSAIESVAMEEPIAEELETFIHKLLEPTKIKIGTECMNIVMHEAGRNPLVTLTIMKVLYDRLNKDEKLITKAHYIRGMAAILEELASAFDSIYYKASELERKILQEFSNGEGITLTEAADRLHLPLNTVTTLTLRLVKKGSLDRISRGKYRLFNPMYARYLEHRQKIV